MVGCERELEMKRILSERTTSSTVRGRTQRCSEFVVMQNKIPLHAQLLLRIAQPPQGKPNKTPESLSSCKLAECKYKSVIQTSR